MMYLALHLTWRRRAQWDQDWLAADNKLDANAALLVIRSATSARYYEQQYCVLLLSTCLLLS